MRMTGLELLQAVIRGELPPPPIGSTLAYRITDVSPGHATFEIEPDIIHTNPGGVIHGGVLATVLDTAAGAAVQTTLDIGEGLLTTDLHVKYLNPVLMTTGTLRCEGTIINPGKRTMLAEARLTGKDDRLYAHATATMSIIRPR